MPIDRNASILPRTSIEEKQPVEFTWPRKLRPEEFKEYASTLFLVKEIYFRRKNFSCGRRVFEQTDQIGFILYCETTKVQELQFPKSSLAEEPTLSSRDDMSGHQQTPSNPDTVVINEPMEITPKLGEPMQTTPDVTPVLKNDPTELEQMEVTPVELNMETETVTPQTKHVTLLKIGKGQQDSDEFTPRLNKVTFSLCQT